MIVLLAFKFGFVNKVIPVCLKFKMPLNKANVVLKFGDLKKTQSKDTIIKLKATSKKNR